MVMEALCISERYGLNRYISEQPPYNLLDRRIENELVPLCQKYDLAILPWSPLAMGILAGRYTQIDNYPEDSRVRLWGTDTVKARVTQRGIDVGQAVAKLAQETPASFVGFDLLARGGESLMAAPQSERRAALERLLKKTGPPVYLTPMTRDRAVAERWLNQFEGAGLDGVIAKPADSRYQPGKRAMIKVKHVRTADCVVAGFRWHKTGKGLVGSLLLGLYDDRGMLQHVGVTSSFTMARRKELAAELAPLRENAMASHPWREWAQAEGTGLDRMPGGQSRWSAGKDLSWEPLRIERVCEVKYDHLQGDRFRHATTFLRWRPDKPPRECRYDQLEITPSYELAKVFSSGSSSS
jgi:ATP-dependent DNA ligase